MAQYLVAATAVVIPVNDGNIQSAKPITVSVFPGSGNTSLVEYSTSLNAAVTPGSANWLPWANGTVAAASNATFTGTCTALRFTRVTGASTDTFEVLR